MGLELFCRMRSRFLRGAVAIERSILNSAPMCESANFARSGSEPSALKK